MQTCIASRALAGKVTSARRHRVSAPHMRNCVCRRERRSGRCSARILCSQCARHSWRAAPSTPMPHPVFPAPGGGTLPQSTVHQRLPHRRCPRPAIAPPQNTSARAGGQPAVCIRPWLDPPVALTRLKCNLGPRLRAGVLAQRRCGSRLTRWRQHSRSRRMTVAAAPRTPLPPFESISTREVMAGF